MEQFIKNLKNDYIYKTNLINLIYLKCKLIKTEPSLITASQLESITLTIKRVLNTYFLQVILFFICLLLYISCQTTYCMEQDLGAMHTANNLKLKIWSHQEAGHPELEQHYDLNQFQALCADEFKIAHGLGLNGEIRVQTLQGEFHLIQELYQQYGYDDAIIFPASWGREMTRNYLHHLRFTRLYLVKRARYREVLTAKVIATRLVQNILSELFRR